MNGGINFSCGHFERIIGLNDSDAVIAAGAPVEIEGSGRTAKYLEAVQTLPHSVKPASETTEWLGVALEDIPPRQCGEIAVDGAAPCKVDFAGHAYPKFVRAQAGKLKGAPDGWRILLCNDPDDAVILLGYPVKSHYRGSFAVIRREDDFFCCNTEYPDSGIAGETDAGYVSSGTIMPDGNGSFYLYIWFDGETYRHGFSPPGTERFGKVCLAELCGGVVYQKWTSGMIHWAQWYIL